MNPINVMRFFFIGLLLLSATAFSQQTELTRVELIKVKKGHLENALAFYEHNWKAYRDSALKAGHIKSYKLLRVDSDSLNTDIILMTTWPSRETYNRREEVFQGIMKTIGTSNGPAFKNGFNRREVITTVGSYLSESIFKSDDQK